METGDGGNLPSWVLAECRNDDDDRVKIDQSLKGSVNRLVRSPRDMIFSKALGGVKIGGNEQEEMKN